MSSHVALAVKDNLKAKRIAALREASSFRVMVPKPLGGLLEFRGGHRTSFSAALDLEDIPKEPGKPISVEAKEQWKVR